MARCPRGVVFIADIIILQDRFDHIHPFSRTTKYGTVSVAIRFSFLFLM